MKNIIAVFALLLSTSAFSAEWEHVKDEGPSDDIIKLYSKDVAGSQLAEFKATRNTPATIDEILVAYREPDKINEWLMLCTESKKLEDLANGEGYYVYLYFDLVWPLTNRDTVVRIEKNVIDGEVVITGTGVPGHIPEVDGTIRIPSLSNKWVISPREEGINFTSFQAHLDIGGLVPSWAAEIVTTQVPIETLRNIGEIILENRKK